MKWGINFKIYIIKNEFKNQYLGSGDWAIHLSDSHFPEYLLYEKKDKEGTLSLESYFCFCQAWCRLHRGLGPWRSNSESAGLNPDLPGQYCVML